VLQNVALNRDCDCSIVTHALFTMTLSKSKDIRHHTTLQIKSRQHGSGANQLTSHGSASSGMVSLAPIGRDQ
jgi:hypothetical protein